MGNSIDEGKSVVEEIAANPKLTDDEPKETPIKALQNIPPEAIDRWLKTRIRAKKLCEEFNKLPTPDYFPGITPDYLRENPPERLSILSELFNITPEKAAKDLVILPTFWCDYGFNIEFKGRCYFNWNCVILGEDGVLSAVPHLLMKIKDNAKITIGDQAMIGPGVHIYAASHSLDPVERLTSRGASYPITIGDQVWIGGNTTIIGPCMLGDRVVVAAGSVVKGTWPADVLIGGNPARILKHLHEQSEGS